MKLSHVLGGPLLLTLVAGTTLDLDISIRNTYPVVQVGLGTPPVEHALLFDTGSSTLWVIDSNCTTQCKNTSGFNRTAYDVSTSDTGYEDSSVTDSIQYNGGTTTGIFASDIITPGNLSFPQTFMAANKSTWQQLPADGFLGLASSSIAFPGTTSFFENMMQNGLADQPRFGIFLGTGRSSMANTSPANDGILTFGASREADFAAESARFVNLSTPFEVYKVPFQSMNISNSRNATDVNLAWAGEVVIDTGSGLIEVPQDQIEEIYKATPWTYQQLNTGTRPLCTDFTDDWSVSFTIGTGATQQTFSVPGSHLAERGYQDDDHCFPPFNPWDSQNIIIGHLWLRNFYSVFDFGSPDQAAYNMRVGFAPLKAELIPNA